MFVAIFSGTAFRHRKAGAVELLFCCVIITVRNGMVIRWRPNVILFLTLPIPIPTKNEADLGDSLSGVHLFRAILRERYGK